MTDLRMFPEGGVNFYGWPLQTDYFSRVCELTKGARQSICIVQYVFGISKVREWQRGNKIFNRFVDAKKRGVIINVLLDRPKIHAPNARTNIECARRFKEVGIEVRALGIAKTLHLKMLIFDNEIFLAGSHNLTNSSLYSPYELTFECRDPVLTNGATAYFQALFNGGMSEPFFDALEKIRRERI